MSTSKKNEYDYSSLKEDMKGANLQNEEYVLRFVGDAYYKYLDERTVTLKDQKNITEAKIPVVQEVVYKEEGKKAKLVASKESDENSSKIIVKNFDFAILEGFEKNLQESLLKLFDAIFLNVEEKIEEKTSLTANNEKVKIIKEKEDGYVEISKSEYFTIYEKDEGASKTFDITIVPDIQSPLILNNEDIIKKSFEEALTPAIRKLNKFKLEDFFPEIAMGTDGLTLGILKSNFQLIKESYQGNPIGFVDTLHSENTNYPEIRATFFSWWFHEKLKADNSSLKDFYTIFRRRIKENDVTNQTNPGIIGEIFIQSLGEAGSSFPQTTAEILSEWNSIQPDAQGFSVGEIFIDEKIKLLIQNENSLDAFTLGGQVIDSSAEPLEDKPKVEESKELDKKTHKFEKNIYGLSPEDYKIYLKALDDFVSNAYEEFNKPVEWENPTKEAAKKALQQIYNYAFLGSGWKKYNKKVTDASVFYSANDGAWFHQIEVNWCGFFIAYCARDIVDYKIRNKILPSTYRIANEWAAEAYKLKKEGKDKEVGKRVWFMGDSIRSLSRRFQEYTALYEKQRADEKITQEEFEAKVNKLLETTRVLIESNLQVGDFFAVVPGRKKFYGSHYSIYDGGGVSAVIEDGEINFYVAVVEGNVSNSVVSVERSILDFEIRYRFLPEDMVYFRNKKKSINKSQTVKNLKLKIKDVGTKT